MARKQQTRARDEQEEAPKAERSTAQPAARKSEERKAGGREEKAEKAGKGGKSGGRKAAREREGALEFVTQPIAETTSRTKKSVRKAADEALKLVPEVPQPAIPTAVTDLIRTIGGQIATALNTDVGRVMVAELLIYIAKSLTKAAADTDTARDATSAIMSAGAKIGAAAADAGARMVETGGDVASSGVQALGDGAAAAGTAAGGASNLVREVAQVAVGAMGGAVVEAASKVMGGRSSRSAPKSESKPEPKPEVRPEPVGLETSPGLPPRPIPAL